MTAAQVSATRQRPSGATRTARNARRWGSTLSTTPAARRVSALAFPDFHACVMCGVVLRYRALLQIRAASNIPCETAGKGTDAVNRLFDPSTYRRIFGGADCLQMPDTLVSKCRGSKDHEYWCALLLPVWAVVRCGDRNLDDYIRSCFNGRDMLSMTCFVSLVVLLSCYQRADRNLNDYIRSCFSGRIMQSMIYFDSIVVLTLL